jgi:hypothetical protein
VRLVANVGFHVVLHRDAAEGDAVSNEVEMVIAQGCCQKC